MKSKLQEDLSDAPPVPVYMLPWVERDDEISLIDLWHVITARKMLVLLSFLAAVVLGLVYAFLVDPVYRATVYLLPPQQNDIQALLVEDYGSGEGLNIQQYTTDFVYTVFQRNLKSRGLRREFFDARNMAEYYLADKPHTDADIDRIFAKKFDENLLVRADMQDNSLVVVSFAGRDPELTAQRLNQFIAFTDERTVHQLYSEVNAVLGAKIEWVRYHLTSESKHAAQSRKDLITNLREALVVARAIEKADNQSSTAAKERMAIEISAAQPPLYLRGVKALEAEIAALESRKSDEPFVPAVRDLQDKLAFLSGISIDRNQLSAVTIDSAASTPFQAEKPRKKLIFMLSVVFGLIVGILLAFFAEFWSKVRTQSILHAG